MDWTMFLCPPPPTKRHKLRLLRHGIWTVMGTCALLYVCTTCTSQLSTDSLWSNFCFCIANVSVKYFFIKWRIFVCVSLILSDINLSFVSLFVFLLGGTLCLCPLSLSLTDCLFLLVDLKGLFYIKGIRPWYVHSFLVGSFKLFMVFLPAHACLSVFWVVSLEE